MSGWLPALMLCAAGTERRPYRRRRSCTDTDYVVCCFACRRTRRPLPSALVGSYSALITRIGRAGAYAPPALADIGGRLHLQGQATAAAPPLVRFIGERLMAARSL
jgi:hypothetical protein